MRRPMTSTASALRSEASISEPPSANITPIEGKTNDSQPQPRPW